MGCFNTFDNEKIIEIESKVRSGESLSISNNRLLNEKAESSVFKIIAGKKTGNGFLCKFKYYNQDTLYLITCYHVISNDIFKNYDEIELIFNNNKSKKLNIKEKRDVWFDNNLDFIAIEIKDNDELKVNTFEINDDYYKYDYNYMDFNKRSIIIPCLGDSNEINLPQGIINYPENEKFMHDCNTESGNSGAPIILVNNIKIIGIHQGYHKIKKKNIGLFFQNILKHIIEKQNKIEVILEIDEIKNVKVINHNKGIIIFKNKEKIDLNEDNLSNFYTSKLIIWD